MQLCSLGDVWVSGTQIEVFIKTYEQKIIFINYPYNFVIYFDKGFVENRFYTAETIDAELNVFDSFSNRYHFARKVDFKLV